MDNHIVVIERWEESGEKVVRDKLTMYEMFLISGMSSCTGKSGMFI